MSEQRWFKAALCRNRRACADCRTKLSFRESLHRAGMVHEVEFRCPHGFTAHDLPEPIATKQRERKPCSPCS